MMQMPVSTLAALPVGRLSWLAQQLAEPESRKANRCGWLFCWYFVVGRAGFEPATNGLKVRSPWETTSPLAILFPRS
jgi:hypothetical protein